MPQLNAKTKKLIFYAIMAGIFAYLAFIMISFYSSDRVGMVKLSFSVNEENIVTSAYATYKMKPGEGRLTLSQDNDLKMSEPENAVSHAIILSTEGNPVTEVELELEYDENLADEDSLALLKQDENGFTECEFSIDKKENIIKTKTQGEGVWVLASKNAES
ncbi:MAG: hypothetical protein IJN40_01320 [Clostridia bacterium]|nr:hypothetical protein [Clostridia bacterium]